MTQLLRFRAAPHDYGPLKDEIKTASDPRFRRSEAVCVSCGGEGTRTPDPLHAMQVRYQLRHTPRWVVVRSPGQRREL